MFKQYEIEDYQVYLMKRTLSYAQVRNVPTMAQIRCYLSDTTDFSNALFVFVEGQDIPENYISPNGSPVAFVSGQFYALYLDILRNERPVSLVIHDVKPVVMLWTKREPVGEGPAGDWG